jgi:hypothetical protein
MLKQVNIFQDTLDAAVSIKSMPKYFGLGIAMWLIIGVTNNFGMTMPTFIPVAVLFFLVSVYRPKFFLYLLVGFFMFREAWDLMQIYSSWGVNGGFGQGRGVLSFLRYVHPGTPTTYQMPKVIWGAMLFRIGFVNRSRLKLGSINRTQGLLYGFVAISLLSATSNLAFDKTTFRFIVELTIPFVLFFYIKTFRMTKRELQFLFGFIIFLGVEMQIIFNVINNFDRAIHLRIFFGDDAIGTFKHPRYELSAWMMTFGFFLFLYRFLVHRQTSDLFRCMVAFYGVLSVSVILFTVLLMAFTVFSFFYAFSTGLIKVQELALAGVAAAVLGGLVVYQLNRDAGTAAHLDRHMNKNEQRAWWETPKIYSFINLFNMMEEEGKFFLGVGPGRFLSSFGHGYYQARYNSYTVYQTTQLSSSERLENSTVGIIGEVGLLGYLCLILAYYQFYQQINRRNALVMSKTGKPEVSYAMVVICMLFFMTLSLIRNSLEEPMLQMMIMIFVSLIYQFEWHREKQFEQMQRAKQSNPAQPMPTGQPVLA